MGTSSDGLIVSVSGIRGIIGGSFAPESATRFARCLGIMLGGGRVVVCRDSRPSGAMLRHAVISGLMAAGCTVDDLGIAPTPTCGLAVRHLGAVGAVMITASHNPAPWNGLKLFGSDGAVLSSARGLEVLALFQKDYLPGVAWNKIGLLAAPPEVGPEHLRRVTDAIPVSSIASQRFSVLIDGNGGAGGPLAVQLLEELGCEIITHGCQADGDFLHEAEPIPAHLTDVAALVAKSQAAVGFALDPDADRLALIDETGTCISEEITLALAVKQRLAEQRGPVVINMSTSRMVEDIARDCFVECVRTPVGEANVVGGMKAMQAIIGGEGNGGVIDPLIGWVRDPYIGMARILALMASTGQSLSQLIAELPSYAMLKTKFALDSSKLQAAYKALETHYPDAKIDRRDGLRLDWSDRWLHLRASNTEPVVRVIAESPTTGDTETLCTAARAIIESV